MPGSGKRAGSSAPAHGLSGSAAFGDGDRKGADESISGRSCVDGVDVVGGLSHSRFGCDQQRAAAAKGQHHGRRAHLT